MSEEVKQMFSEISARYDLMNDILSFGVHRRWRRRLTKLAQESRTDDILDCAGGTGDVAFELKKAIPGSRIICTDFCEDMLVIARKKAAERGADIEFRTADAMHLPFPDNTFDLVTISFGIRNVDDVSACLVDMARVTKPGGRVMVLEFGAPRGLFGSLYKFYSRFIMPALGRIFAGAKSAYTYLPETAARFPARDSFIKIMEESNSFSLSKYESLTFGVAYIYTGIVK
jgi:demethylmenaquinone methyltransferase/2-methoxy-6-polyprenyl-1,4-benzoquinol methylase